MPESNVIQLRPSYRVRYAELKTFQTDEEGAHILLSEGDGPEGRSYAVILMWGPGKDPAFEIIREFKHDDTGLQLATPLR
jgi:hypothetical protein